MAKNKKNNNSSPYRWFREGNVEVKKNPLKNFLKFFKIFIYVALLGISLTGCVQSMVIRTSTKTGSGLEFYNSVAKIPPNVKTFDIAKRIYDKDTKKQNVLAFDAQENYWLQDQNEINGVHKQIKSDGGLFGGHSTGKRAWKSKNMALRFSNGTKSFSGDIVKNGSRLLAVSTTQTKYVSSFAQNPNVNKSFDILVPKKLEWDKLIAKSGAVYDTTNWEIKTIKYNPTEIKSGTSEKVLQHNFTYDSFFTFLNYMNENKITIDKSSKQWDPKKKAIIMNAQNKAFMDSYLTATLATNWYVNKGKSVPIENKAIDQTTLSWKNTQESRAVVTWSDAWHLGPFYAMFVFPLSKLTIKLIGVLPVWAGWGSVITIFILVLVLRTLAYGLSFKSTLQQVKQQEVQAKIAQINAKYEPYKGNRQMENRKKQETFDIYKKEGISPIGAMGSMFVTMPIFLSMWRVIGSIPHLKSTSVAGIVFAATSYKQVLAGQFQYIVIMLLSSSLQVVSILLPRWLTKRREKHRTNIHQQAALKKQNKTQTIMAIVFAVVAAILPAGVSIYMIFSALYQIGQNSLNHKIIKWQKIRSKRLKGIV